MKLKDFDFRIWNGKKYLKQKIYNDNINNNEYIAVTGNIDDENYVFTIEHGCERDYYGGDYDEYCKVKDFTTCNYKIELWTGFYDKNGKKIYEGDILYYFKDCSEGEVFKYQVLFKEGAFYLFESYDGFVDDEDLIAEFDLKELQVMGNIHENKELLNVRL
ncbi:TPA: YopX family protein [Campylobacter coli]